TSTIAPKMIGSETFIMVAFKCADNKIFFSFASAMADATKAFSLESVITEESITSPAFRFARPFNSLTEPSAATNSILNCVSCSRSEEHTSELQSRENLVCRLLLEKKKKTTRQQ